MITEQNIGEISLVIVAVCVLALIVIAVMAIVSWRSARYDKGERAPRERLMIDPRERELLGDDWRDLAPYPKDVLAVGDPEDNVIEIWPGAVARDGRE